MDHPVPNLRFRLMALSFKLRDLLFSRMNVLAEANIMAGFHVLDYGCGPGGYLTALSRLVGQSGRVYALDIHPLAIEKAHRLIEKHQLTNVEVIHSQCKTGLPNQSLDMALLYDTFHGLIDPNAVLEELHRALKIQGVLSFSDHHMKRDEIISRVTEGGLFHFLRQGKKTVTFLRAQGSDSR